MTTQSSLPINTYLKIKWRGFWHVILRLTWSDWLLILIGFIPFLQAIAENLKNWPWTPAIRREIFVVFIVCIPTFLVFVTAKRNLENYQNGLLRGTKQTFKDWSLAQRGLTAGLIYAHSIQKTTGPAKKSTQANLAVRDLLVSIRKTVVATFDDVDENQLVVTVGVPNLQRTHMTIVEMMPILDDREKGHVYDIPVRREDCHSMTASLREKIATHTPDTTKHPALVHKPYKSILSFPVLNSKGACIAVVNVDGPGIGMFTSKAHQDESGGAIRVAHHLIKPALAGLVLAIEGGNLYNGERR